MPEQPTASDKWLMSIGDLYEAKRLGGRSDVWGQTSEDHAAALIYLFGNALDESVVAAIVGIDGSI